MSQLTFKQFLTELMVDLDPTQTDMDQLTNVRKNQMMAKQSPDKVIRSQLQQVQQKKANVQKTDSSTKSLELQIAQQQERLLKLQQQLANMKKADQSKLQQGV